MNRDVARRAICAVLAGTLPIGHAAYGVELYARAIGDPYSYQPEPAPSRAPDSAPTVPATSEPELHALPGLGSEDAATAGTVDSGWSWKRILVGVAIVGAMAALANKGGGGGGGQVAITNGAGSSVPAPDGSADPGSGGGGISIGPAPGLPGVDDDDDDDRKGKRRR